jgi:hypothetical protein
LQVRILLGSPLPLPKNKGLPARFGFPNGQGRR